MKSYARINDGYYLSGKSRDGDAQYPVPGDGQVGSRAKPAVRFRVAKSNFGFTRAARIDVWMRERKYHVRPFKK